MKCTIYKIRYEVKGELLVHLFGRGEDGKRVHKVLKGTRPYLYIPKTKKLPNDNCITEIVEEGVDIDNNPLLKVYVDFPFNVPSIRNKYPITYEADILYEDRVRYDHGIWHTIEVPDREVIYPKDIKPLDCKPIPPNIAIVDIENEDELGLALPKYPTAEVLVVGIWDKASNTYTILFTEGSKVDYDKIKAAYPNAKIKLRSYKDEKRLFMAITQYFQLNPPDIITNWNINYDLDYLRERAKTPSRKFTCPNWDDFARMDTLAMYVKRYVGTPDDLHLDYVSQQELGEGKVERTTISELYRTDMAKLLIYNIKDLELVDRLIDKKNLTGFFIGLCQKCGSSIEVFAQNSKLADAYFLHKCHSYLVLPTVASLEQGKGIDKGGWVGEAFTGLIRKAIYLDLKTAYPNAVRTGNYSQETYVKSPKPDGDYFVAPSGRCYSKKPRGLVPIIYDQLVDERYQLRERMHACEYNSDEYTELKDEQEVLKFFTNSLYGVMGSDYFRLNAGKVGSDITGTVRMMIAWVIGILERSGFKVWYGDTDGILFTFPDSEDWELDKLKRACDKTVKHINKSFQKLAGRLNAESHHFEIKLETINEVVFQWGRKKRYIQVPIWDGQDVRDVPIEKRMIIKGAHSKRRDSSRLTKALQKKLFQLIVEGKVEKVRPLIKKAIQSIEEATINPQKLAIPMSWRKEYKTDVPQVRAPNYSNTYLGKNYKRGDSFWVYLGTVEGKPKTDVVALDWDDDPIGFGVIFDIPNNVRRHIVLPSEPILEALGMSIEEIMTGLKQSNLTAYLDTGKIGVKRG